MIEKWSSEFKKIGFRREKKAFLRDTNDYFQQAIWDKKDKYGKNEFLITLAIQIPDKFKEPIQRFVALDAYPNINGITLQDNLSDFKWWADAEAEQAKKATFTNGIAWLEEYSNLDKLRDYYEDALTNGMRPKQIQTNGIVGRIWQEMAKSPNSDKPRRPPVYHEYLSLIYYEKGDFENAYLQANRRLYHLKGMRLPDEPDRTIRMIKAMGYEPQELEYCDQCEKKK